MRPEQNDDAKRNRSWAARAVILLAAMGGATLAIGATSSEPARFDPTGRLLRPADYREWVFVGSPITPNDLNDGKAAFPEFHHVYVDPASWEHYGKTGEFREGTIFVKELVSVGSKRAASGNGYFAGERIGLEATVKSRRRFPNEPGNWAYFRFTDDEAAGGAALRERADPMPTASCNACHAASARSDWVFSQYYPALRAHAKP